MTENKFEGYFSYYISKVSELPVKEALMKQKDELASFYDSLKNLDTNSSYAPEKWSIAEVVFHNIETEIIMLYRAIRISRGDETILSSYDENMMVEKARVAEMNFTELLNLHKNTRENTLFYFNHFTQEELDRTGKFSGLNLNVEGLGYLIAGHALHHIEVLKERYL